MKVTARKDDRADSAVDQHRDTDKPVAASKPGLNQRRFLDMWCVQRDESFGSGGVVGASRQAGLKGVDCGHER